MSHFHLNKRTTRYGIAGRPENTGTWFTADAAMTDYFRKVAEWTSAGWIVTAADTHLGQNGKSAGVTLRHPATDETVSIGMWACTCESGEIADDLRPFDRTEPPEQHPNETGWTGR